MYLWARSWGIQPSEFWDMTISEWWAEYDLHTQATPVNGKYAGKLTEGAVQEIAEWMKGKANGDP